MKRKFSIFLNLILVALCISSVAFGVYSAQKAQLNITGNLGFTAHNAFVSVTGLVKNVAQIENDNVVGKTDMQIDKIVKSADTTAPVNITMPLGDMYFYSNNNNVSAEDIVFELTFTNLGETDVLATITKPSISSTISVIDNSDGNHSLYISFGTSGEYQFGIYAGASATIQFALHLNNMSTLLNKVAFNMPINFEETFLVDQANNFFWNNTSDNTRSYVTMGQVSESDTTPIRWYIFAKSDSSGNMQAVTSAVDTNGTLEAGTYWFISEYVLEKKVFDDSSDVYGTSEIKAYLDDNDMSTASDTKFTSVHNISLDDRVYSKIDARTLPAEEANDAEGAFAEVANQKLWLLSVSELAYLNNNEAVAFLEACPNFIAQDTSLTASDWWLRSPASDGCWALYVFSDGSFADVSLETVIGVRPAFQITIK